MECCEQSASLTKINPPSNRSRTTYASSWLYEGSWEASLPPMGEKAWESVAKEVIIDFFKVCGIETDGMQEGQSLVHCMNLEKWQLTPQQRFRPRLIAGKQYCSIFYVKYCMHTPQNREVSHICGAHVVAERKRASTLECICSRPRFVLIQLLGAGWKLHYVTHHIATRDIAVSIVSCPDPTLGEEKGSGYNTTSHPTLEGHNNIS